MHCSQAMSLITLSIRSFEWSSVVDFDASKPAKPGASWPGADTSTLIFGGQFDPGRLVNAREAFMILTA